MTIPPTGLVGRGRTVLYLVTEDWYFVSHRLPLARRAIAAGYRVVVATRFDRHEATLRELGCETVHLPWSRGAGGPWTELGFLRQLIRLYRTLRPDIVHHVALKPVVFGSLAARFSGLELRVVNAIAGLGYVFTNRTGTARLLRPLLTLLLRSVLNRGNTVVILQNPDDLALLQREVGLREERAVRIPGGVSLERFTPVPIRPGDPVVVLPARMLWDKGVGEFVDAARQLKAGGLAARFVLAGGLDPANPRAIDEATLRSWVAEGTVEWWGHRDEMAEVYHQATIVALPSYREGMPKTLLEASASGRAMVTTDVPGCRDVVTDGVTGLLVPARDAAALAGAIGRLLADPALIDRFGRAARSRCEAEFGEQEVARRTVDLYGAPIP